MLEMMEPRVMMTVVAGYTEMQYAGGSGALRWVTSMDFAPNGDLFVAEQYDTRVNAGVLFLVKDGQLQKTPVLTLPDASRGFERGLVGVMVDPNFNTNHNIYVYWTATSTPGHDFPHNVISRFTMNGDVADPSSQVNIFEQDALVSEYHNGGSMHIGPDGKLYVAVGDNADRTNSQSLNTTKGKILRLNLDGSIPTDNPFYNQTTGNNRAIYALGLRNPFTFNFQPGTGRMFINDVGLDTWEEIDDGIAGANYGWSTIEGPRTFQTAPANYHDPLYAYKHPADGSSSAIVGSLFWRGEYYFGDYGQGYIKQYDPATGNVSPFVTDIIPAGATQANGAVDIDQGPDGAMYFLVNGIDAKVFRVAPATSDAPSIDTQPEDQTVSAGSPATFTVTASGSGLSYQWQRNGVDIAGATSPSYTIAQAQSSDNGATFRVVVSNSAGQVTSNAAKLTVPNDAPPVPVIDAPADGTLWQGGTSLAFSGGATDAEDGTLPGSALTWSVDYYTGTVPRPLYLPTTGITGDSVDIPAITPFTEADVFLRITLTAIDSSGVSTTVTRDLQPQKSNITVKSSVPGLTFLLDGTEYQSDQTFVGVVGIQRTLAAPATQTFNGVNYEFTGWSDGVAGDHAISTPAADTIYIANYSPVVATPPPPVRTPQENKLIASIQKYATKHGLTLPDLNSAADLAVLKTVMADLRTQDKRNAFASSIQAYAEKKGLGAGDLSGMTIEQLKSAFVGLKAEAARQTLITKLKAAAAKKDYVLPDLTNMTMPELKAIFIAEQHAPRHPAA